MAYVAHIVEQIQHNVAFLAENGHMTQQNADAILAQLPGGQASVPVVAPVSLPTPAPAPAPLPRRVPAPPVSNSKIVKARAIWAYNEHGQVGLLCLEYSLLA